MSSYDIWVREFHPGKVCAPHLVDGGEAYPAYLQRTERFQGNRTLLREMYLPFLTYYDNYEGGIVGFDGVGSPVSPTSTTSGRISGYSSFVITSFSDTQVNGRRFFLSDRPQYPFWIPDFTVRDGRNKPAHHFVYLLRHLRPYYNSGNFDVSSTVEPFGNTGLFARKITESSSVTMFVKKTANNVTLSGTYMSLRPIYKFSSGYYNFWPFLDEPVNYDDVLLPREMSIFEIGNMSSGSFSPVQQRLVFGESATMRAGLARERLHDMTGTQFVATAYLDNGSACGLQFGFAPADQDSVLCGAFVVGVELEHWPVLIRTTKGFDAGQFPALWLRKPDHAATCESAFFAGAVARPPVSFTGATNDTNYEFPQSPEWATWQASQFPFTLRRDEHTLPATLTKIEPATPIHKPKTPVFSQRVFPGGDDPAFGVAQPYPVRTIDAKCKSLQTSATYSQWSEKAAFLVGQQPDNAFVFEEKKITGLSVTFAPYLSAAASIPTGQFQQAAVPANPPGQPAQWISFATRPVDHSFSSSGWRGDQYWRADGPQTVNWTFTDFWGVQTPQTDTVYTGVLMPGTVLTEDGGPIMANQPAGPVSAEVESAALIGRERLSIGIPRNVNVVVTAQRPQSAAPPTGSYELEPLSLGGVQGAPGMFYFAGTGDWSLTQTLRLARWVNFGGPSGVRVEIVSRFNTRTTGWEEVEAPVVDWNDIVAKVDSVMDFDLATDHIEIYASFGSALQEAGDYLAPKTGFLTLQDRQYERARTHDIWDAPKGIIRDEVVYVAGNEPRPLLRLQLYGRTVMRGQVTCSFDTTNMSDYPGSYATGEVEPYSSTAVGAGGFGVVGQSVLETHHPFASLDYTFTREQTLALMAGQEVEPTEWKTGFPNKPALMDFGSPYFKYKVTVQATVEPVTPSN